MSASTRTFRLVAVVTFGAIATSEVRPETLAQRKATGVVVAQATLPARTPPATPSDEADRKQLDMARQEGEAYQRSLQYMIDNVADSGAKQPAGDYVIAYAMERAEGMYGLHGGKLAYHEPTDENLHLEISVSDAGDGRFVPYLEVRATLVAADGQELGPFEVPFVWHPGMNHYGKNVKVPGGGTYALRIRVGAPSFMRHDKINGQRFENPVEVVFRDVKVKPGKG